MRIATHSKPRLKINRDELTDTCCSMLEDGEYDAGICICCGEVTESGVEPDAEWYPCEGCGEAAVFGVEQALLCYGRM